MLDADVGADANVYADADDDVALAVEMGAAEMLVSSELIHYYFLFLTMSYWHFQVVLLALTVAMMKK